MFIRIATTTKIDCNLIFALSNDPLVRANSFNTTTIDYTSHCIWYDKVIKDKNILFFLIFSDNNEQDFIGQIRFARNNEDSSECLISLSITEPFRNKHIGSQFLKLGISEMLKHWSKINSIVAQAKDENIASNKLFTKNKFKLTSKINTYKLKPSIYSNKNHDEYAYKQYDYVIVGSGLYGATFAFLAKQEGKKCLLIEKRHEVGGNIRCKNIEGINVHTYGAHIFHTSNKKVWDFVNHFITFNRYTNSPVANYYGKLYNLPFNMNTFYAMWKVTTPEQALAKIEEQKAKSKINEPKNLEEQAIALVGRDIYEILVKEYTEKQWGRKCSELPPFIIKRLPVRFTFDNNYFNDLYQGIPIGGYNKLIEGLLEGIDVVVDADFFADRKKWENIAKKIVFTGKIDEFFDYKFGKLEYRTVRFETEVHNIQNFQGNAVINYTSHDKPYTRIIEHKHFEPENPTHQNNITVISKEYSSEWAEGSEPFYPVNDERNSNLYSNYYELASKTRNVIFGGRLAEYKYYDMDDVIEKAMNDFEKIMGAEK